MNILITGATGLIGYHLVKELLKDEDAAVYAAGRNMSKLKDTFSEYTNNSNLNLCVYNEALSNIINFGHLDYIFHLAGPIDPETISNRPVDVIQPNVVDLNQILNYAVTEKQEERHCRVVVASSCAVYQNNFDEDVILAEEDAVSLSRNVGETQCYSESKRFAELIAASYVKQFNIDVVCCRIAFVYGYTKNMPKTAIYDFMRKAINGEKIEVQTANLPRRDWIYVEDVIKGMQTIADKASSGEVVNISSNGVKGNFAALDEFANVIGDVVYRDKKKEYLSIPESTHRMPGMRFDNAKIHALGWNVKYSFEEGIRHTIKEYMDRNENSLL